MFKKLCLATCLGCFSIQTFALPPIKETVTDVMQAIKIDQTEKIFHQARFFDRYASSYISGMPEQELQNKSEQTLKIKKLLEKNINSAEFKNYYSQILSYPYYTFFEEEQLIHILHISDHPLAKEFYQQTFKHFEDDIDQSYADDEKTRVRFANQEAEIEKVLKLIKE